LRARGGQFGRGRARKALGMLREKISNISK
jgi:hypothetical protein